MPNPIPIKNLYYLFLYAWDRFPEGQAIEAGATDGPDVLDLFAKVLINGARRLLRRGLDRGYREAIEETANPRGRFLLAETMKRNSLAQGRAVCVHGELVPDVLHNRILKAALSALTTAEGLDRKLVHELRLLHRRFVDVSDVSLSPVLFRKVQLSRNSRHYDLLLHICRLILDCMLPGEGNQHTRFAVVLEDEVKMSTIFEAFIRNFYRSEQNTFVVSAEQVSWDAEYGEPWHARHLPLMRTDATLRSFDRTIVIDAKFYRQTMVRHMEGAEKVRSAHLYQLLTYLRHVRTTAQAPAKAEGLLLYPKTSSQDLRLDYILAGHRVRVRTLALDCDWRDVKNQLLEILQPTQA